MERAWGMEGAGTDSASDRPASRRLEHVFRYRARRDPHVHRAIRPHLGSPAVPSALGPPHTALPRPAHPHTRAPPPSRPYRRPRLRPRQRHHPPRRALARGPHHRLRPLPGDAPPRHRGVRRAHPGGGSLDFRHGDLATWLPEEPYDLIVSNAALQWVPGHPGSFGAWINGLRPGGTFAFQIPGNFTAPSHALLAEQCDTPRWRARLAGHGARYIHLLEPAEYLARFTELGCAADIWETTYHQLLQGPDPVLDWVKGTALRPVLTALGEDRDAVDAFLTEYRDRLRAAYPTGPRGTVFPFRRIFAVARKEA